MQGVGGLALGYGWVTQGGLGVGYVTWEGPCVGGGCPPQAKICGDLDPQMNKILKKNAFPNVKGALES